MCYDLKLLELIFTPNALQRKHMPGEFTEGEQNMRPSHSSVAKRFQEV